MSFSLLAEEALYSRRVFAVARCGWCSGITRMRLLRVSPPDAAAEGGWGRCCCCYCCWDWDCRAGEDGAVGVGAVEKRERERARSGDPFSALHHPDMAKRGTPTHPCEGPGDAAIRWRWRAFPKTRRSLIAMTDNQVEMPLRSVRMCPAYGIYALPDTLRGTVNCIFLNNAEFLCSFKRELWIFMITIMALQNGCSKWL